MPTGCGQRPAGWARAEGGGRRAPDRVYSSTMTMTVPEAYTELDALRERLKACSERLSWLRSYL